LYFIVRYFI